MGTDIYTFLYGKESINHKLFMVINHAVNPIFDVLMPVFTYLGDSWRVYPYLALLVLLFLVKRDLMPLKYIVVYSIASFVTFSIVEGLKGWLHVPRPAAAICVDHVRVLVELKLKDTIPSGHATFSFMSAYVLSQRRGAGWRVSLFLFALLVAYSRIYVGAHYPFDVVVSGLLGTFLGFLTWKGYEGATGFIQPFLGINRDQPERRRR